MLNFSKAFKAIPGIVFGEGTALPGMWNFLRNAGLLEETWSFCRDQGFLKIFEDIVANSVPIPETPRYISAVKCQGRIQISGKKYVANIFTVEDGKSFVGFLAFFPALRIVIISTIQKNNPVFPEHLFRKAEGFAQLGYRPLCTLYGEPDLAEVGRLAKELCSSGKVHEYELSEEDSKSLALNTTANSILGYVDVDLFGPGTIVHHEKTESGFRIYDGCIGIESRSIVTEMVFSVYRNGYLRAYVSYSRKKSGSSSVKVLYLEKETE